MARSGLYKTDVKKARDSLLAQGRHPSVDAVRIALGNTGSKSTIHKYLKELEEEEGSSSGLPTISESLQDLVGRLAAQLQTEADERIAQLNAAHQEEQRLAAEHTAKLEQELAGLRQALCQSEDARNKDQAALAQLGEQLQQETLARHTSQQLASDLKERLLENETYRQSLEEKHQHARDALEHYRQSVKEQRDQDIRRHEQQVQQLQSELRQLQQSLTVRQEEITRLNREGAVLVSELTHAKQQLREQDVQLHDLQQRLADSHITVQLLAEKERQLTEMQTALATSLEKYETRNASAKQAEQDLAACQARVETQQSIMENLRALLQEPPAP